MAANLISQLINDFQGSTLTRLATALGESSAKTQTAIGAVLPAVLGSLAYKASTTQGANDLLDLIRKNKLDSSNYGDISTAMVTQDSVTKLISTGRPLLDSVLGGKSSSVTEWLSSFASINKTASSSLLSLTLPLVLGAVSKKIASAGASATNLANFLQRQMSLQPAPAGLAGVLGLDDLPRASFVGTYESTPRQGTTSHFPAVGTYSAEEDSAESAESTWWKWALPVLALGLLGYFLSTRQAPTTPVASIATSNVVSGPFAIPVATPTPTAPFVERKLAKDVVLNVPEDGIESKLIAFIQDPNRKVDNHASLSFDRLEFDTDSAMLQPSSEEQLRNIAEILKAYPTVKVKIGGYTDNVGDDAHNLKLSQDRAANTMNEIANLGIGRSRMTSEGYGRQYPVADNATEEGRQRNRRIAIHVTSK